MATMTRGEFAIKLARFLNLPLTNTGGFSDVTGRYDTAVTALKDAGIVVGTGGGVFDASATVTRDQAATMFARAANLQGSKSGPFTDLSKSAMSPMIQAAGNAGLFTGTAAGTFSGSDPFQSQHFDIVAGRYTTLGYGGRTKSTLDESYWPRAGMTAPEIDPDTPPPIDTTPQVVPEDNRSAIAFLEHQLRDVFGITDPGITDFLTQAYDEQWSEAEIELHLYDPEYAPWFAEAFPEIRARVDAGLAPINAFDVINLRSQYRQLLHASAAPAGFYDSNEDSYNWIVGDVSPAELARRLRAADNLVAKSAPEVRQYFAEAFGAQGDSALFAYFLDNANAPAFLEQQVVGAGIGAAGGNLGMNIAADRAMRLAGLGHTTAGATAAFNRINRISGLFEESVSEHVDLTMEGAGIDAEFGLSPDAARQLEQRRLGRISALSGGGGAATSQQGVIGFG